MGLTELKKEIWKELNLVRVYLVRGDEKPNFENPIIVRNDNTLSDIMMKIGTEFARDKKLAKIWGKSAKFPGQEVSLSTTVSEGMQVRFL